MGRAPEGTPDNWIGKYSILSSRSSKTYLMRIYFSTRVVFLLGLDGPSRRESMTNRAASRYASGEIALRRTILRNNGDFDALAGPREFKRFAIFCQRDLVRHELVHLDLSAFKVL